MRVSITHQPAETNAVWGRVAHLVGSGCPGQVAILALLMALLHVQPVYADTSAKIKIVSARSSVERTAQMWSTPEQWKLVPAMGLSKAESAVMVKYPDLRYHIFQGDAASSIDVLYVDQNLQITHVSQNIGDAGYHSFCEPVMAAIYLPGGFVAQHGIEVGNLIIAENGSLHPEAARTDSTNARQLQQIITQLKRSAKTVPASAFELGDCYLERGAFPDAEKLFLQLSTGENRDKALIGAGLALAGQGKIEQAVASLAAAIEFNDTNEDAYLHLSRIFKRVKKMEGIVATLATGLARHPEMLRLRITLAGLYVQAGRLDEATALLSLASELADTEAAQLARVRGDISVRQGNLYEAAKAYAQYLRFYPYAPGAADLRLFIARHQQ